MCRIPPLLWLETWRSAALTLPSIISLANVRAVCASVFSNQIAVWSRVHRKNECDTRRDESYPWTSCLDYVWDQVLYDTCSAKIFDKCLTASLRKLYFKFSITDDQWEVIFNFIWGKDVFVSLLTGAGKSLCFAVLPYLFFCHQFFYWWHLRLQQVEQVAKEAP